MTVTFGRLGRIFALAGLIASALTGIAALVLDGTARIAVLGSLGVVALVALVQGAVWTAIQHRMFGSIASLRLAAEHGTLGTAVIRRARATSSRIGADAILRLDLTVSGRDLTRHVRVPSTYAAAIQPGTVLPVRLGPERSRALIVDWDRLRDVRQPRTGHGGAVTPSPG